jgi:hypothetical protein
MQADDGKARKGERRMKTRSFFLSLLAAVIFVGCLLDGGGSSETTNGLAMTPGVVSGSVRNPDGTPSYGARVVLRQRSYLKESETGLAKGLRFQAETRTDSSGAFSLDSVEPGDYFLEANDSGRSGTLYEFSTGDRDSLRLETRSMTPTGTVIGTVAIDSGRIGDAVVQIYGLDRLAHVDAGGHFAFSDLPAGSYTLRAQLVTTSADPRIIAGVQASSSDTTDIGRLQLASFDEEDYGAWAHARRFVLNTTPSGADVKNNVVGFPLLLRLNTLNFDFSQSDGKDLRFADVYGKRLHYQVERWDSLGRQAEVWVSVDTVHGNSRQDYITMYWGKPGAPSWSDGRAVFDTAAGYGGEWHLSEEEPGMRALGVYQDATPAAQNGDDFISSVNVDGLVGPGHGFDFGDYIRATPSASLRPAKYILVSGWFRGDTTDNGGTTIAGLGDSYGLRVERNGNIRFFTSKGANKGWHESTTKGVNVLDSAWHHVAGVFDGANLQVFVDGVEKSKISANTPITYDLGPNFYIGRHGNGKTSYDLNGQLDEVGVVTRNRGTGYVKLCFESQRINPTLVEFQP